LHLTPPSSLRLLISENKYVSSNDDSSDEDDSSNKDEDTATAAAGEDTDEAGASDDLFPMAKTAPKKRGAAAGGRKAPPKKSSAGRMTTGEETIDLDTPPRGRSHAPPPLATRSRRGAVTPSTPTPTARRTRLTSCSMRVACPPRMPSPRSPSYLEGRH